MNLERLQKIIAASGLCSRREAERFITEGRVTVNGVVVLELGTKAHPLNDKICVDSKPIPHMTAHFIVKLHKPRGIMTTRSDPEGRKTVMDLLPENLQSVYPVGRLDFESEGLLLLTNNGELALKLTHPRYETPKTYEVWLERLPQPQDMKQLTEGLNIEDERGSFFGTFDELTVLPTADQSRPKNTPDVLVRTHEGKNRFIRRMFESVGYTMGRLRRISM